MILKIIDPILPTATYEMLSDVKLYYLQEEKPNWWCSYMGKYYAHPQMRNVR